MKRFVAIIPSRYASTRFPGKSLAEIGGKPMIRLVYERVAEVIEYLWVATDDERIFRAVGEFGGRVVMTSGSCRSGTDRCAEALDIVEAEAAERFDVVINVQGDEPFVAREHIEKLMALFDDKSAEIGTLVKPFGAGEDIAGPDSPKVVTDRRGRALYFSRSAIPFDRAGVGHEYLKHIGLYGYRADVLRAISALPEGSLEKAESLEQLRWLENGYTIRVARTEIETVAVDRPEDLQTAIKFFKGGGL